MSEPVSKFVTQVMERRSDGNLWPVATVHEFSGGELKFTGDPRVAFGPLLNATRKATSLMVLGQLHEAMSRTAARIEAECGEGGPGKS